MQRARWGILAALVACGGSTTVEEDSTSSSGGATSSTSSGGSASTSSTGGSSTGTPSGTPAGTPAGTPSGSTMLGSEWAAQAWPGGLDHIIISTHDLDHDRCLRIYIDAPTMGAFMATAPSPWGVNGIEAWPATPDCLDSTMGPPAPPEYATAATGSVTFVPGPNGLYPCDLDVSLVATFTAPPMWLEPTVTLQATMVEVDGGCP